MQHHLQQLRVPWFLEHGQWRMIKARDGKFLNRGSRINIDSSIREVQDQDEIVSTCFIIARIPRYLTRRQMDFFHLTTFQLNPKTYRVSPIGGKNTMQIRNSRRYKRFNTSPMYFRSQRFKLFIKFSLWFHLSSSLIIPIPCPSTCTSCRDAAHYYMRISSY